MSRLCLCVCVCVCVCVQAAFDDRNVTSGVCDISLRTGLQGGLWLCVRAWECVRARVFVCVKGVVGWLVGWCRGSQPVEEPLAPDISTGLADHSYYRSLLLLQHRSVVEARTRSDVWTGGARSSRDPLLLSPHPPVHRADLTPTTRFSFFFFFFSRPLSGLPPPPPAILCVYLCLHCRASSVYRSEKKKRRKSGCLLLTGVPAAAAAAASSAAASAA